MGIPNPISGLQKLGSWLGGGISSGLRSALDWLYDSVNNLWDRAIWFEGVAVGWVNDVYSTTSSWVSGAYSFASSIVSDVYGWASAQISHAYDYASQAFHNAIGYAESIWNAALGAIADLWHGLQAFYDSAIGWVIQNIWDPLWQGIHEAWNFIENTAAGIFNWVVDNVWNPLVGLYHQIIDWVTDAVNWVEAFGAWVWHLLKGAEHWLIWLASLSWDEALMIWNYLTHPNFHAIAQDAKDGTEAIAQEIEDVLMAWLDL